MILLNIYSIRGMIYRLVQGSLLTLLVVIYGCTSGVVPAPDSSGGTETGGKVVAFSRQLLGSPYRYGGDTPQGFDCSGLVRYVYRQVGIKVPHTSMKMYKKATKIPMNELIPGDLLFFKINRRTVSHVGIYMDNLNFIHAPSRGKTVRISSLDTDYWASRLVGAGRYM